MAHVNKFSRGAIGHLFAHFERTKNIDNVDLTRSHLNYNLADKVQPKSQLDFLHSRLSEVKVQNRKDVNVVCSWIVTLPKDVKPEDEKKFFQATFDFLQKRYGAENVVSAHIHKDEVTPHMHYAFVPICKNLSKGGEKLSAKEVITRKELQTFHQDLSKAVENSLGYKTEILNGATSPGNKSVIELKTAEAQKELDSVKEAIRSEHISQIPQKAEFEAILDVSKEIKTNKSATLAKYPKRRRLFGKKIVEVPFSDFEKIITAAASAVDVSAKFQKSVTEAKELFNADNYKLMRTVYDDLSSEHETLREKHNNLVRKWNDFAKILNSDEQLKEHFQEAKKAQKNMQFSGVKKGNILDL